MSHQNRHWRWLGLGATVSLAAGLAVSVLTIGSAAGGVAASTTTTAVQKPDNTSPPSISGTAQVGKQLTGDKGSWANTPTDYNYFWVRCDKNGGSCANISGAHAASYTLTSADVGNTIRFKVEATNAAGSNFASSVPSAVVIKAAAAAPAPAPAPSGCPAGSGTIQIGDLKSPARLSLDGQQADPAVVHRGTREVGLRYHVSACGGRSVQGALVYVTAVPFAQFTIPTEQPTAQDGWASLDLARLAGFPVSPHQQLIALFARARKSGESLLAGISGRRLFSVRVNLNG